MGFPATDLNRSNTSVYRTGEAGALSASSRAPLDPKLWRTSPAIRRFLFATTLCGVIVSVCAISSAVLLAHITSRVITDPFARSIDRWAPMLVALAAVWAVRAVAQFFQARVGQRGASAAIADLSGRVLSAVTAWQTEQLAARRDDAAAVITRGLDALRPYFTAYLPSLLLAAILTPVSAVVVGVYDLRSAVVVLITLPLIPIFMVLIGQATAERSAAALEAIAVLQARLLDLIAGIPTLRALGRATGPERRIAELAAAQRRSTMASLRVAFLSALVLELLATLGVAMIAVGIGMRLVFGEISLMTGLTVLLLAPDVYRPLRRVGVEFHAAQDGRSAAEKAFALIEGAVPAVRGTRAVPARGATIVLKGLSVAGRDGLRPLRLSAEIRPGQVTVLTGVNGAGKSTTLQVVAGITAATNGTVTVSGVSIADLEPAAWWRQLSWLPQRPVLIPGTVTDNLSLFGDIADIEHACATSGFNHVLEELPEGLDTVVGSGGVGLSLGQRQRLGLARAFGSSAPLLLLDEPTAHLDAATESLVLRAAVERAKAGDTVILVGHRESVIGIGDHIIEVTGTGEIDRVQL